MDFYRILQNPIVEPINIKKHFLIQLKFYRFCGYRNCAIPKILFLGKIKKYPKPGRVYFGSLIFNRNRNILDIKFKKSFTVIISSWNSPSVK